MKDSGIKLTLGDIDDCAVKITSMWNRFNEQRQTALRIGQEVRQYIFATAIDSTSSANMEHKNRTHIPKLTELSDTLQSNYWDSIFGEAKFFVFKGETSEDKEKSDKITAWIRSKLEAKKFRQIEGRKLVADYVIYGNAFIGVDYIKELDKYNVETFKGATMKRISPLDIVFDAQAETFDKSPKIQRLMLHISTLAELIRKYPSANFNKGALDKILKSRQTGVSESWAERLHKENFNMDGFASWEDYFKQDYVEILIYRGDIYNNKTGEAQKRRIIWVADRLFELRNEENPAPIGKDGIHHVAWRIRPDNLWGMSPLDNLLGMQYRINKVENAKADALDLSVLPITILKGADSLDDLTQIMYKPGQVITLGIEEDIQFESPDVAVLQYASSHMAEYFALMENFAGAPPEERGIRTPGEKTAEEIRMLDTKGSKLFRDKARAFEIALEGALDEAKELTLLNFDGEDYVQTFDDIEGAEKLKLVSKENFKARGRFSAIGSKHWDIKNKRKSELSSLLATVFQDPKYRAHIDGWNVTQQIRDTWDLQDTNMFERFRGVKEDVELQAIAQAEMQQLAQETGQETAVAGEEFAGQGTADDSTIPE